MDIAEPKKQYKTSHSWVYSCQYHAIFCSKFRRKIFVNGIDERLKELILEKQSEYSFEVLEMEVMLDHVHLLLDVHPQTGIAKVIAQIKGYTASQLRKEYPSLKTRLPSLWTRSKFVSTVGTVKLEDVKRYIEDQKGV